jgi:1-deoxy-D-xylulose-5-phosphate reductoisomerase
VEKVTLTASGGPFRTATREAMAAATPEQACAHPRWSMGRKISVDSATLMNKGLELIEASYLFGFPPDSIDIVVHPESVVHSFVHYVDGSVLAQLATPDMRIPIAYALTWPDRAPVSTARLDLARLGALTFQAPDTARFPALGLCRAALGSGAGATTALSAANEVAVEAFLAGRIRFLDICRIVEEVMAELEGSGAESIAKSPTSFDEVGAVDQTARRAARRIAGNLAAA